VAGGYPINQTEETQLKINIDIETGAKSVQLFAKHANAIKKVLPILKALGNECTLAKSAATACEQVANRLGDGNVYAPESATAAPEPVAPAATTSPLAPPAQNVDPGTGTE